MTDDNPYASPPPDVDPSSWLPARRLMTLIMLVIVTVPLTSIACAVAFYFGWEIATMIALGAGIRSSDVDLWGMAFGFLAAFLAAGAVAYVMIRAVQKIADRPTRMEQAEPQEPPT